MNQDERRILRQVWLNASRDGRATIELESVGQAKHLRLRLYKVAAAARTNSASDPDLAVAANRCSIRLEGQSVVVEVVGASAKGLIGTVARAIGFDPQAEDEARARELLKALEGQAAQKSISPEPTPLNQLPAGRATKYYSREE